MTNALWERPRCDPFSGSNPFLVLGVGPNADTLELTRRAEKVSKYAADADAALAARDALLALTQDPLLRCMWALWTPSSAGDAEEREHTPVVSTLGRWLFAGAEPSARSRPLLAVLARTLGWTRPPLALDDASLGERWRVATHRFARRWEYWHQLAVLYSFEARVRDDELEAHEADCMDGRKGPAAQARVEALLFRSLTCWTRAAGFAELWEAVRKPVASMSLFRAGSFEELQAGMLATLTRYLVGRLESALVSGNRLTAARRARFLRWIAQSEDLPAVAEAVRRQLADMRGAHLHELTARGDSVPEAELGGFLLLFPEDVEVARLVLNELARRARREPSREAALATCREVVPVVERLDRRAFPRFPEATLELDDEGVAEALLAYHWLLGQFGNAAESSAHVPYHAALVRRLKELEG